MSEIEESIERVENLYRTVTGKGAPPPDEVYAPIPAEKDPSQHVEEQMQRLFEMLGAQPAASVQAWTPSIAVWEGSNDVTVFIDIPGVGRDRVELSVQSNVVTVAGNRPAPIGNGHKLRFGERPLGPFRRILTLPPGLKTAELSARLRDGVLEVVIPREAGAGAWNPRPVPIA
jgi:HSP20 family protein